MHSLHVNSELADVHGYTRRPLAVVDTAKPPRPTTINLPHFGPVDSDLVGSACVRVLGAIWFKSTQHIDIGRLRDCCTELGRVGYTFCATPLLDERTAMGSPVQMAGIANIE